MTFQIFQLPKQVLITEQEIKPSWKVSFFLTTTTTPTPVYTTSALSVTHTQPVQADSGGVMATIYLDPAITYKASVYDEDDVLQYTVDPVNDSLLSQSAIGLLLYPRTAAEISAGVTPTNYAYVELDIRRYGALIDGSTSDYAALVSAALVAAAKGRACIDLPAGSIAIASASLPITGIPANCIIRGAGMNATQLLVTGSTAANLFRITNKSGVTFMDLTIRSNSQAGAATGEICYFEQTAAASVEGTAPRFINCRFENCKADNWLGVYNDSTSYDLVGGGVFACEFASEAGNARGPTSVGVSSSMITLGDSAGASTKLIRDFHVSGCKADGTYVKTFLECWHNTRDISVTGNTLKNFHDSAAFSLEDVGLYVFTVYKGSPGTAIAPDLINISGNIVDGFTDCGAYIQGADRITISGQWADGTGTTDGTLPKGAIALNSVSRPALSGNDISNCTRGVQTVIPAASVTIMRGTNITAPPASAKSLRVTAVAGATSGKCFIDGLTIANGTTTTGAEFWFDATYALETLHVRNFSIEASTSGIVFRRDDTPGIPAMVDIQFENGSVFGCASYGIRFESYSSTSQRASFKNITIGSITSTAYALSLDSSVGLDVDLITFRDIGTSAYGLSTAAATGTLNNIRYQNTADADRIRNSGGTDLGRVIPTHSGNIGDFVQNCGVADHNGSNMLLRGWQNYNGSTGWRTVYDSTVSPAT